MMVVIVIMNNWVENEGQPARQGEACHKAGAKTYCPLWLASYLLSDFFFKNFTFLDQF